MALYVTNPNTKFKAYGEGNNPIFRGSLEVQDETWTDLGSGLYSLALAYDVHWLQIDGQDAKLACTDWIDILDIPADNQVEVDPLDLTGLTIVGAYAVCYNRPYSYSRGHLVSAYSAGVMTLRRNHGYLDRSWVTAAGAINSGVDGRVKLFGLADYIKNDYDWAFESGTLYVKLPSAPSNFVIRAVREDSAIKVKASGVDIDGVEIIDYHRSGITVCKQGNSSIVQNCDIHHIREDGVRVTDINDSIQIIDNEVSHCDVRGIYLANINNAKINRNTVHNIGVGVNDGWLKDSTDVNHYTLMGITQSAGLRLRNSTFADTIEINDNYVHDVAWCGIHFLKGNGKILRNYVQDILQVLPDGGGIYTAWGLWDYPSVIYAVEIGYNKITGVIPGIGGPGGVNKAIYQDNGSGSNEVHHNIIWDFKETSIESAALFVNSGSAFQKLNHNIVIVKGANCLRHLFIDNGVNPGIEAEQCEIHDEIYINLVAANHCMRIGGNIYQNGGFGDNNYFFTPYSANKVAYNGQSLATWQALYGQDANSRVKENWLTYVNEATAENTHVKLYVNHTDTDVEQEIPAGYEDIDGNDVGGQTLTVPAHYGLLVLKSAN